MKYIKHERLCLTTFVNTERKRVENMMHRGVFLNNFKVFWHGLNTHKITSNLW